MMRKILTFALICLCTSILTHAKDVKVSSPDGSITVTMGVDGGKAWYQVNRGSELIIGRSSLGFVLKDGDLKDNFKMGKVTRSSLDETWSQPWGEDATVRNHYNELRATLHEKGGMKRHIDVVFRAFNDGVAFRYEFPRQPRLQDFVIMDEATEFALPTDAPAWSIPALTPYYEGIYTREHVSQKGNMSGPVAIEMNDSLYMAIMDANLTDYSTMNFSHKGTTLKADLVPWKNGDKVRVGDTRVSPWRAIIIGRKAADILLSRMALNLNEPCKIEDTSWIKPTKYVGIWWALQKRVTSISRPVMAWAVYWLKGGTMAGTLIGQSTVTASVSPRLIPIMTCKACAAMLASAACALSLTTRLAALPRTTRTNSRMLTVSMSPWASTRSRRAMSIRIFTMASCSIRNGVCSISARSSRRPPATT